jgi:DNA-binding NtrC family response regulator
MHEPFACGEEAPIVVLVVQEEQTVRRAVVAHLRQAGFDVVEAVDADSALAVLHGSLVDAVCCGLRVPGAMDGLALVRWIHRNQPEVMTVLTAGSDNVVPILGRRGIFLAEPYRLRALEQALRRALRGSGLDRRAQDSAPRVA